jgi:calcium/calmodulin-dependent protein kinase I
LYSNNEDNSLIKVSDFGLAKFLIPREGEMLFTACGTPNYVAPEIIDSKGYDLKVDCWSLGVILYVMLCGFPPFYADDNSALFKLIQGGTFEFPSPYWDTISDNAKDLIQKLLVINPAKRLSTDEILKHPWMTGSNNSVKQLPFQQSEYEKYKGVRLVRIYYFYTFSVMLLWRP